MWVTYVYSCNFTRRSRVLVKLIIPELVNIFPTFCGSRSFIAMFTRACNFSLSWARSFKSTSPSYFLRLILISSNLCVGLPSGSFPQGFQLKPFMHLLLSYVPHALPISFFIVTMVWCIMTADGGDVLQMWRLAETILNKQLQRAVEGWSSSLGLDKGLITPHCKKLICYEFFKQASDLCCRCFFISIQILIFSRLKL
jgi:hypothetical protein